MASSRRSGVSQAGKIIAWSAAGAAFVIALPGAHAQSIGRLRVVRQVQVSRDIVAPGRTAVYADARDGQSVFAGQGLRTLRRSQAEISFADKSVLRVGERTDLVVQDTATLRRIQMQTGLVWVRVHKGTQTQVETPSATAVARGTEFTVQTDGTSTVLTVYEGVVEFQVGGQNVSVSAGQRVAFGGSPPAVGPVTKIAPGLLPVEYGGALDGWWETVAADAGLAASPGSSAFYALRTTTIAESIQQIRGGEKLNATGSTTNDTSLTDAERAQLLRIAQSTLVPDVRQLNVSLDAYRNQVGSNAVTSRFGSLDATDAAFLLSKNITSVSDFLTLVQKNSANLNAEISSRALSLATAPLASRSRAYYRPSSITGEPNFDLRLLDSNESNDSLIGIGAAASLLASALSHNTTLGQPKFEISGFGFANDPHSLAGGRASLTGRVGRTRYQFEANALSVLDYPSRGEGASGNSFDDHRNSSKLASVAVFEQTVAPGVTVFAGRRRFYHGPVFQNFNLSQLIADRYSGAGVTVQRGAFTFDGGYAHDTNPVVQGAQHGALGSLFYKRFGGQFGVHYLHVPKLSGGDGITGSASLPLVPSRLDFYTEIGRGPDRATLQTYGLYLPGLFQSTQTDVFVEYGSHDGVGHSLSLTASRDVTQNLNFRGYVDFASGDTRAGLAAVVRLGN